MRLEGYGLNMENQNLRIPSLDIYGSKNQYSPNFPSECQKPGVCIIVLNLLGKKKSYFSQMFLKIHPLGPAQANGSLQV